MLIPGTPPANHPPSEACVIHSKQHRGCGVQDPGTHGYRWWKTADFSHSAGTAHGAPPYLTMHATTKTTTTTRFCSQTAQNACAKMAPGMVRPTFPPFQACHQPGMPTEPNTIEGRPGGGPGLHIAVTGRVPAALRIVHRDRPPASRLEGGGWGGHGSGRYPRQHRHRHGLRERLEGHGVTGTEGD